MNQQQKASFNFPLILITSLFFLWALAHNLNPILIPHLKKACTLTDFQSALIDSSFFIAYFVMALPAGFIMRRYGYKTGIVTGLLLFATGAFLFYPAASVLSFASFLCALFVIASGLTFLETAANPYVTILGSKDSATQRLNFAQSFNGLGASIAAWAGGKFILSGKHLSESEIASMTPDALHQYYINEASSVQMPYLIIGGVVLAVALLFMATKLPDIYEEHPPKFSLHIITRHQHLRNGIIAQFFYVGAQVSVGSFFIRFLYQSAQIDEKAAAGYLAIALLLFMIGRFAGTFLMQFIQPQKLLSVYSVVNVLLLAYAITSKGITTVYALMAVEFFMSIMFPTIFSLSIKNLGSDTKLASSFIIMSIVGGAFCPLALGKISDLTNVQTAYVVPLTCFLVVLWFGVKGFRLAKADQD